MVYTFDNYNYVIRLDKGEKLVESLDTFVLETHLQGAWINGIGGVLQVELGFYDLDAKAYQWRTFDNAYEITNLHGSLAMGEDGKPAFHLHGTFCDAQFQAIGGHVKEAVVAGTCELFVHRSYKPLHRRLDAGVGLNTLAI